MLAYCLARLCCFWSQLIAEIRIEGVSCVEIELAIFDHVVPVDVPPIRAFGWLRLQGARKELEDKEEMLEEKQRVIDDQLYNGDDGLKNAEKEVEKAKEKVEKAKEQVAA